MKHTPQLIQSQLPFDEIPYGYCHCGCGGKTLVRRDKPNKFIHPHQNRVNCRRGPIEQRFWSKVVVAKGDGCWIWTGNIQDNGYGKFYTDCKGVLAHRFAYALTHGPIPDDLLICHHCDRRACVRVSHLFIGTQRENIADMFAKERQNRAQGERHGLARFTNEQARALRQQFSELNISVRKFSQMYNVPDETMRKLINRETYKNI